MMTGCDFQPASLGPSNGTDASVVHRRRTADFLTVIADSSILGNMGVNRIESSGCIRLPCVAVRVACLVFLAFLAVPGTASAGDSSEARLFATDEVLEITLKAPLETISRDQEGEPESHPATLLFSNDTGDIQSVDIRLRIRGNYRRQSRICRAPPLYLDLPGKKLKGTVFEGQDKIKLVSHCQKPKRYQQFLLKEYLAYRVLNLLTDVSHRVRLLQVTYIDTDRDDKQSTHYAFFIEHKESLARRLGLGLVKVSRVDKKSLDETHSNLVAVFQYLIGNTDWSMLYGALDDDCCHNIVPLSRYDGKFLPLAYDFDFSGVVNASYAEPNPKLPIRNVRQRLYRGFCTSDEMRQGSFKLLNESRAAIRALYDNQPGLDPATLRNVHKYYDDFYDIINDQKKVERQIIKVCL
jgi:hypothetical protein